MLQLSRLVMPSLIGFLACSGVESLFAQAPKTSLEGQWRVGSATWQMGGLYIYSFKGNSLTIETRINGGKDGNEPPSVSYERFMFVLDTTATLNRLVLTTKPENDSPPTTRSETIKFDERGWLWLTRNPDWKTGLQRIE